MDAIMHIARRHGLLVVEDAAQAVNSRYKGRWLGTIGDLGCFSFHETKNFSSGEGGALLVNDARLARRAEIIREKGTNRSQFLRGQVDKYTWVDVGSSYVPSDILAAHLLAQMEHMDEITYRRGWICQAYAKALQPLEQRGWLRLPRVPDICKENFHMFYLLVADMEERTELISHLKGQGITAAFHYVPLHTSPIGQAMGANEVALPRTEELSQRLVRLPLFFDLTDDDVCRIVKAVTEFFRMRHGAA
jgi:dTDP-4-amino-4,6-dideoxygalactose transaminase